MIEYFGTGFAAILEPLLVWIRGDGIGPGLALIIISLGCVIGLYILRFCLRDLRLINQAKKPFVIFGQGVLLGNAEKELIEFKEALIFAFLGVLKMENIPNCLSSVTGASEDVVGGVIIDN